MTLAQTDPTMVETTPDLPRPSVAGRLTQILDVFATGPERMRLEDIARLTGLPRSTAFRLLTQLVDLQWMEHDSRGYRLGLRLLGISRSDHSELRAAASAVLNELHVSTGGVAHLTVLEGSSVYYLDKIGGAASSGIPSRVAARLPAESTVSGRALLAGLAPEQVDSLLSTTSGTDRTAHLPRLHAQLNRVRQQRGISYVPGESCPMEISAVAAPVLGPHGVVGAVSVACPGVVALGAVAPMVWSAARQTSQTLFPHWNPRSRRHLRAR